MATQEKVMAILMSLLDPSIVQRFMDGGEVVDENYTITPEELVDYPDTLGLFTNYQDRLEYYTYLTQHMDADFFRFDLFHIDVFHKNSQQRKFTMYNYLMYILKLLDSNRKEIKVFSRFVYMHFGIHKAIGTPTKFFSENINSLWDFVYLSICVKADENQFISKIHGCKYMEFDTVGRQIADTYLELEALLGMVEYKSITSSGYCRYATGDLPKHLIVNYYYRVDDPIKKPLNAKTLLMGLNHLTNGSIYGPEVFSFLHLDPIAFTKTRGTHHAVALNNVHELPNNDLGKLYKNIVEFTHGDTNIILFETVTLIYSIKYPPFRLR